MRKLMVISLIIFFFSPVLALQYRNTCDNDQTLNKFMNFTACENVTCIDYNFTQLVQCEFGCDNSTQTCRQSPINEYSNYFFVLIGIIIIVGVIWALYKRS